MEKYKLEKDVKKTFSKKYCHPFGNIAVDMGFITSEQLTEALAEQVEDSLSNKPHRSIGSILFENGWITRDQINFVVLRLFKQECSKNVLPLLLE